MNPAPEVLLAIATELAKMAKAGLPELNDGEEIRREWYEDGVYYRETAFGGEIFCCSYGFRQRKSRRVAVRIGDRDD